MEYEKFLWECKMKAESGNSKIEPNSDIIHKIRGMSTPKVRHFMNNLNSWGENYLEVGSHKGSTFVSSLYQNEKRGWSIDNFSEFCDEAHGLASGGTHKNELLYNINSHLTNKVDFFQEDCFTFNLENIKDPVDVYMYDGDHDQDKQRLALEYFYPVLNDIFLFIVDDWNSQAVRDGTYQGIKDMDLCILGEIPVRTFGSAQTDWWSGIYAAFLSKGPPDGYFLQTSISAGGCNYAHPMKNSRPRDNVLRLSQPENGKTIEEIRDILSNVFQALTTEQIETEIEEGLKLLKQQEDRGMF